MPRKECDSCGTPARPALNPASCSVAPFLFPWLLSPQRKKFNHVQPNMALFTGQLSFSVFFRGRPTKNGQPKVVLLPGRAAGSCLQLLPAGLQPFDIEPGVVNLSPLAYEMPRACLRAVQPRRHFSLLRKSEVVKTGRAFHAALRAIVQRGVSKHSGFTWNTTRISQQLARGWPCFIEVLPLTTAVQLPCPKALRDSFPQRAHSVTLKMPYSEITSHSRRTAGSL